MAIEVAPRTRENPWLNDINKRLWLWMTNNGPAELPDIAAYLGGIQQGPVSISSASARLRRAAVMFERLRGSAPGRHALYAARPDGLPR